MPQTPSVTAPDGLWRRWSSATPAAGEPPEQKWWRRGVFAGLVGVALAFGLLGVAKPGPSADEAATMLAVNRSWVGFLDLIQGKDAVHVPYYALVRVWASGEGAQQLTSARTLSAVAMALAAGLLYLIVARRIGILLGAAAAVLFTALPSVTRFAQEARPFALLVLATVLAWFTRDLWQDSAPRAQRNRPDSSPPADSAEPEPGHRGRSLSRTLGYGLALASTGLINLFGLLQWPAQVVADLTTRGVTTQQRLRQAARTVMIMAVALLVIGYPGAIGVRQGTGPAAMTPFTPGKLARNLVGTLTAYEARPGAWVSAAVIVALAAIGGLGALVNRRQAEPFRELTRIATIWLGVPVIALLVIGALSPNLVRRRFWLPVLPPLAVLALLGLAVLAQLAFGLVRKIASGERGPLIAGSVAAVAVILPLAVWATASVPLHQAVRRDAGHRMAVTKVLKRVDAAVKAEPGIPVLVRDAPRAAVLHAARPDLTERNLLMRFPDDGDRIWPSEIPPDELLQALEGHTDIVWVEGTNSRHRKPKKPPSRLAGGGFKVKSAKKVDRWWVIRLTR